MSFCVLLQDMYLRKSPARKARVGAAIEYISVIYRFALARVPSSYAASSTANILNHEHTSDVIPGDYRRCGACYDATTVRTRLPQALNHLVTMVRQNR